MLATGVPVAVASLSSFRASVGLMPMMPTDAEATRTLLELQEAFGVGPLFPTTLVAVPPAGSTAFRGGREEWLARSCAVLREVAAAVDLGTSDALPPFTAAAFAGPMILDGFCISADLAHFSRWSTVGGPYSATEVRISYQVDPFSSDGQRWIERLRGAVGTPKAREVAAWHVVGVGPTVMDVANRTFARFPLMVALMMGVVFVVVGVSFQSLLVPLRAVLCLLWMLVVTFGLAVLVFQDGWLAFLQLPQLGPRSAGAMSWMSPCMAFPVVVGLGLDYDIFYSGQVVDEWERGHDVKTASLRALALTANTISAAGVIMVVAFTPLLLSTTPALNEISFLVTVSVLLDCFVTTKVIIPCAMAILGDASLRFRQRPLGKDSTWTPLLLIQQEGQGTTPGADPATAG